MNYYNFQRPQKDLAVNPLKSWKRATYLNPTMSKNCITISGIGTNKISTYNTATSTTIQNFIYIPPLENNNNIK